MRSDSEVFVEKLWGVPETGEGESTLRTTQDISTKIHMIKHSIERTVILISSVIFISYETISKSSIATCHSCLAVAVQCQHVIILYYINLLFLDSYSENLKKILRGVGFWQSTLWWQAIFLLKYLNNAHILTSSKKI